MERTETLRLPLRKRPDKKSSRWHVILTVPHGICPRVTPQSYLNTHPCDLSAAQMGSMIQKAFQNLNISTYLVMADVPRTVIDLNRLVGRNTELTHFRNRIRSEISLHYPYAMILDIHSYPKDKTEWVNYNMVILDSDNRILSLGKILNDALEKSKLGIQCLYVTTTKVNDIMDEALYEYDIYAALLEFNETMLYTERINIANAIASIVKKFIMDG